MAAYDYRAFTDAKTGVRFETWVEAEDGDGWDPSRAWGDVSRAYRRRDLAARLVGRAEDRHYCLAHPEIGYREARYREWEGRAYLAYDAYFEAARAHHAYSVCVGRDRDGRIVHHEETDIT
jgi:hypothetical protein